MIDDQSRLSDALAGRYTVEREVGRGGMATVYLARDEKHRRQVALKVLNPTLAHAVGPARFLREIEIAARLNHPHILPLYDSGQADDTLYYVMPFVEGQSLHDRLAREKQLAVEEAIAIAREVADALHHAHTHGIMHRDIKPANIMLLSKHAVVADFGVALLAQAVSANDDRLTTSGMTLGTPLYMSPEQANGEHDFDGRSDIYSLGCVLYEMLSGEPPFTGPTPHAVLAKKLHGPPTSLRAVRESVTATLESITLKALARTPADRFRTAAEFADALDAAALEYRELDTARRARSRALIESQPEPQPGTDPSGARRAAIDAGRETTTLTRIAQTLALIGGGLVIATIAGFISTTVYDQVLNVPYQYTPSRGDFTIIGLRALIPAVFTAFALLVLYVVAKQVLRLIGFGLRRSPHLRNTLNRLQERSSQGWQQFWRARTATALAEVWFAVAIVATAVVLARYGSILRAASSAGTSVFSCEYREVHLSFTVAMVLLITGLSLSWHHLFRWLAQRRPTGSSLPLARWGGLVLIVGLTLVLSAPWRLAWTESPRALLDGERYYIIRETEAEVLLFNPRTSSTERYRIEQIPQLQRLNRSGPVFEGAPAFASPEAGC